MRKVFLGIALFALCFMVYGCGGGGSGSASTPSGEPSGVPSVVQLEPSQFIAQTNGSITLNAKVLDGNGRPVPGVQVKFGNAVPNKFVVVNPETAVTNVNGVAVATVSSSAQDFATIEVEVRPNETQVWRDTKTVFFTSGSLALFSTLRLEVCGNDNDSTCDEPEDRNLFETAADDEVNVRAVVLDRFGERASGVTVTFGSDTTGVTFPAGTVRTTGGNGEASVLVRVLQVGLRPVRTVATVTASADNGAFNATSLFLEPIKVAPPIVSASPLTVAAGGTSNIRATVLTSIGGLVPDGTVVNFTASCGSVTPFAQTTAGQTPATGVVFTSPNVGDPAFPPGGGSLSCTVTAQSGGVSSEPVTIVVAPPGSVQLSANPVTVEAGGTSALTAGVLTSLGTLVPNGTIVTFSTTCGSVTPFAQTSNGLATGTFSAPGAGDPLFSPGGVANVVCFVTAQSGGVSSAPLAITVTAPPPPAPAALKVTPAATPNTSCSSTVVQSFVITGGTPGYTVTPSTAIVTATVTDSTLTVVPLQPAACNVVALGGSQTVNLIITDTGTPSPQTVTATITIVNP